MSRAKKGGEPVRTHYLSVSRAGWTVIVNGMPVMATAPALHQAESVARRFKLDPLTLPVWDGDTGTFHDNHDAWQRRPQ